AAGATFPPGRACGRRSGTCPRSDCPAVSRQLAAIKPTDKDRMDMDGSLDFGFDLDLNAYCLHLAWGIPSPRPDRGDVTCKQLIAARETPWFLKGFDDDVALRVYAVSTEHIPNFPVPLLGLGRGAKERPQVVCDLTLVDRPIFGPQYGTRHVRNPVKDCI